jgi:nucleotide-binding universal stress UspA family protein
MSESDIVAGTDGSEDSLRAVEWAAKEARRRGARLRIVSVPELWFFRELHATAADASVADRAVHAERTAAERAVKVAAQRASDLAPDLTIETVSLEGPGADQLIASAAGAQMLVVGHRGSGGFSGLLLGSTSRYLATHAPLPVVVTREETTMSGREITVGIHRQRQSDAALRFGFDEAELRGASLLAIEAIRGGMAVLADVDNDVLRATAAQLEADLASWKRRYPEVRYRVDVVRAHPGRVLSAASARSDLVVLGRHGDHSGFVGTVVHAVLGHAHGPVAVVPGD